MFPTRSLLPGGCCAAGFFAHYQDFADPLFERLDALADRGRCHVQPLGRCIEAA